MTTPNEPNKTRTIPLHIADQAVAACEAEIQKLKEENAQLKHKLGRLLGAQQEWTLVEPEHYARLKAENERLVAQLNFDVGNDLSVEIDRLKSEVERLRKAIDDADDKLKLLAEWAVVCEVESAQVNQVRDILHNAAKEGKPSV